jgi:hypothetical protein
VLQVTAGVRGTRRAPLGNVSMLPRMRDRSCYDSCHGQRCGMSGHSSLEGSQVCVGNLASCGAAYVVGGTSAEQRPDRGAVVDRERANWVGAGLLGVLFLLPIMAGWVAVLVWLAITSRWFWFWTVGIVFALLLVWYTRFAWQIRTNLKKHRRAN